MKLLLDSHAVIWWLEGGGRLTADARDAVADPANDVFYSAVTPWEFSIKEAAGKLTIDWARLDVLVADNGFLPLPISAAHGAAAGRLPPHHGDPFDRMLIAQAMIEGLTIVTHDRRFAAYEAAVLWT